MSDALAGYRKTTEQRATQQTLVASLRDAVRLSTQRYQGGLDSYLPVLDSQRNLFQSELGLVALQQQELGALVELYRALGGGWDDEAPEGVEGTAELRGRSQQAGRPSAGLRFSQARDSASPGVDAGRAGAQRVRAASAWTGRPTAPARPRGWPRTPG